MSNEYIKYINIYKEYVKGLIINDGGNPANFKCTLQRIDKQGADYKIGFMWPTADGDECGYWPRLPSIKEEPSGIIYAPRRNEGGRTYIVNVFSHKWPNRVLIVRFDYFDILSAA